MFDINEAEQAAKAEIVEEQTTNAKLAIKDKLRDIATARKVVSNLELEYAALLQDIGAGA